MKKNIVITGMLVVAMLMCSFTAFAAQGYVSKSFDAEKFIDADFSGYSQIDDQTLTEELRAKICTEQEVNLSSDFDMISTAGIKRSSVKSAGAEITTNRTYDLSDGFEATVLAYPGNRAVFQVYFGDYSVKIFAAQKAEFYNGTELIETATNGSTIFQYRSYHIIVKDGKLTVSRYTADDTTEQAKIINQFEYDFTNLENAKFSVLAVSGSNNVNIGAIKLSGFPSNITQNSFVMDRTFTSKTTSEELINDGWTLSADELPEHTADMTQDTGRNLSGLTLGFNKFKFGGDYTFLIDHYINSQKNTGFTFNKTDTNKYYKLVLNNKTAILNKNGNNVMTWTLDNSVSYINVKCMVQLTAVDNGKLAIRVVLYRGAGENNSFFDETYTDDPSAEGNTEINSEGNIELSFPSVRSYLNNVQIYPGTAKPTFTADYTESNGVTSINTPVKLIGQDIDIISAIYKDYEMTNCKLYTPDDLFHGSVELFDTTNVDSISTYFWNNLDDIGTIIDAKTRVY